MNGIRMCLVCILMWSMVCSAEQINPQCKGTTFTHTSDTQLPFLWFFSERNILDDVVFVNAVELGDPLRLSELAYRLMYSGCHANDVLAEQYFAQAEKVLNYLVNNYQPALRTQAYLLLKYKKPINNIPAGWWSAMDGFLLALVLENAAVVLNDSRYKLDAARAFNAISRTVDKGGSVWLDGNSGLWFSGYIWSDLHVKDEYYVLNGHLYALHALYFYVGISQNAQARRLYEKAVLGAVNRLPSFKQLPQWSYYMLNPATINQSHYVIFEKMQFESLYALTGNKIFQQESVYRSNLLKNTIPITIEKHEGEGYKLLLLRSAPPHPYNIDIYRTRVTCVKNKQLVLDAYSKYFDDKIVEAELATMPDECTVFAYSSSLMMMLFKTSDFSRKEELKEISAEFEATHDVIKTGKRTFIISPKVMSAPQDPMSYVSNSGRLIFNKLRIDERNTVFGLDLTITEGINIGVGLFDSEGRETFRYYPKLKKGKNLIYLSPLGFEYADSTLKCNVL